MHEIALINRGFKDLNPVTIGEERCVPRHKYGPALRTYTLIHFVVSGKGYFTRGGQTYTVQAGEAFLICPDEITLYIADAEEPWYYQWIGFDGELTKRFTQLPPVFSFSRRWVEAMFSAYETDNMGEYRIAAVLFEMYAELFAARESQNHYVRRVKNYINALYMQPIRIEGIANTLNLDRRYLSRLFKQKTGITVQEYLIKVRMEAAKEQLRRGASVAEAAQLCGYEDACNFSKIFKERFKISPGQWKKSL